MSRRTQTKDHPVNASRFPRLMAAGLAAAAAALIAGCQTTAPDKPKTDQPQKPAPTPSPSPAPAGVAEIPGFEAAAFGELPASSDDDWEKARSAFRRSCSSRAFSSAPLWSEACARAADSGSAREFFRENFTPWAVSADQAVDGTRISSDADGLMTGYYEPVLEASASRSASHAWPVLATPPDLIDVELASQFPELKGKRVRGKLSGRKLVPYDDRRAIDKRTDLYPYAIAWLADPVDQLFLQIQGSGKLNVAGKGLIRVSYDDQNGHPYRAVARWLIDRGEMTRSEASMQKIRAWAKSHPDQVSELLAYNPSYVFFRTAAGDDLSLGPRGAQGVPLTPGASVAVDSRRWKYGTPFFVKADQGNPALHFARPVIAQDTGGAIRGIVRFDYFWGSGKAAGEAAGRQKSNARAWALVPNGHAPEELLRR